MEVGSTKLDGRVLYYDGDIAYDDPIATLTTNNVPVKYVTNITNDIAQYNKLVSNKADRLVCKISNRPLDLSWRIPNAYKLIDITKYAFDAHIKITKHITDEDEISARDDRLVQELSRYKKLGLVIIVQTLIYIVDTLTLTDTIWGVGRGSGVNSYLLFVIGVHDIDSFKYDLDITEFLK